MKVGRVGQDMWGADDPRRVWLDAYLPRAVDVAIWDSEVGEFVRAQLPRLDCDISTARAFTRVMAMLGVWCVQQGIPLDVETVFDPDTCARFIEASDGLLTDRSLSAYRGFLRRLGPALTKHAPWEPRPMPLDRIALPPPYSESEQTMIVRAGWQQATQRQSRAARAVVSLGLGAGLDGRWSCKIRGCDVEQDALGVVVRVPEPYERAVRVRNAFADEVLHLAALAGDGPLVGPPRRDMNRPNRIARQTVVDQGRIVVHSGRLRSTWLVAQLSAGTHLRVLLAAAGVKNIGSLRDLMPYADVPSEAEAAEQLTCA